MDIRVIGCYVNHHIAEATFFTLLLILTDHLMKCSTANASHLGRREATNDGDFSLLGRDKVSDAMDGWKRTAQFRSANV